MAVKMEVKVLTVKTDEHDISNYSGTTVCIVETKILREDLLNGRFKNKQETVIQERLMTKDELINRNRTIMEFFNCIYESIQSEEVGGGLTE